MRHGVVALICKEFAGVLDAHTDSQWESEPLVYRVGAVSAADMKDIVGVGHGKERNARAIARVLNFTGSAFPCNRPCSEPVVLVTWLMRDNIGRDTTLTNHCAKLSEMTRCWKVFEAMRKRVAPIIGRSFGRLTIAALDIGFGDIPMSTVTRPMAFTASTRRWDNAWDKAIGCFARRYGVDAGLHVALLLVGARSAWIMDKVKGKSPKSSYEGTKQTRREALAFIREHFVGVLDALGDDRFEPFIYRVGAVSQSDMNAIRDEVGERTTIDRAFARALNFTGTFKGDKSARYIVSWIARDRNGREIDISQHVAHLSELGRCWRDFDAMRKRAAPLFGRRLGPLVCTSMEVHLLEYSEVRK